MQYDKLSNQTGRFIWQGKYGFFAFIDNGWLNIAQIYKNQEGEARWAKTPIPQATLANYNTRKSMNKRISTKATAEFIDELILALNDVRRLIETPGQEVESMPIETAEAIDDTQERMDKDAVNKFLQQSSEFASDEPPE